MEFDDDMLGLQIEDLGDYFVPTDVEDNWKGFSLGYTDEKEQHEKIELDKEEVKAVGTSSATIDSLLASPLLSEVSELGDGFENRLSLLGSPCHNLFSTGFTPASAKPDAPILDQDTMELENFSLDESKYPSELEACTSQASIKPAGSRLNCPSLFNNEDHCRSSSGGATRFEPIYSTINVPSNVPSSAIVADRTVRKKSREKLRRQEVNIKFDELAELLGLSNRVRKNVILQGAVGTIKRLKRERDELCRDRERLQFEASKLAACLQLSQLGSAAAVNQQLTPISAHHQHIGHTAVSNGLQAAHTHPIGVPCCPGTNCFPIMSNFSNISSLASSSSGQVVIAPKQLKPAPSSSTHASIAPRTEMK